MGRKKTRIDSPYSIEPYLLRGKFARHGKKTSFNQ
jgi:hypothetical protein